MTRDAGFKRRVRARMAKTGEAYSTARSRLDSTEQVLHVTNGDSVAGTLREAGVAGAVLPWRDVLHDGPVPDLPAAELRRVRAEHLAGRGWGEVAAIERELAARDGLLERFAGGEYVLWFEADLYDQLQVIQVLDALRRHGVDPERITLISIGEYRGIARFGGLGELDAAQLAGLAGQGQRLGPEVLDLAVAAWRAFTAPDPAGLAEIVRARSPELRYLGEAFARLAAEYPSRADGLSLTQRRILLAAVEGPRPAGAVFRRASEAERRPFLGDMPCYALMRELADCEAPLLAIEESDEPWGRRAVRLTAAGAEVLAARADHVRLNGIDRWVGGVHLVGPEVRWRYDERLESLVAV